MKKIKILVGVALLAIVIGVGGGVYFLGQHSLPKELSAYLNEEKSIMDKMMDGMKNIIKSGSPSVDFLEGMIPHHEGAIDMAKSYLENGGQNERLVKIANDVVKVQSTEITEMKELIQSLSVGLKEDKALEEAFLKEYNKMFDGSMGGEGGHGTHGVGAKSVDEAFAEGMIVHHEMAIKMAEDILKFTSDEKIKTMAENIIKAQKEEVAIMREILKELK